MVMCSMNIFLTSFDSKTAAQHLDNLRLNKMILETAQLLSSSYRSLFTDHVLLYKSTHINHPCSIWSRTNIDHYSWLVDYFNNLALEKIYRDYIRKSQSKPSMHKSWQRLFALFDAKNNHCYHIKVASDFFSFNCTADYKSEKDVRIAYQKQLIYKWQNDIIAPQWTRRNIPYFAIECGFELR